MAEPKNWPTERMVNKIREKLNDGNSYRGP
jgi:hypothetical protein